MADSKQIVTAFKRKGNFDRYRHLIYDSFKTPNGDDDHNNKVRTSGFTRLSESISSKITKKLNEDPKLTTHNRGKTAGLLTGYLYKDEEVNRIIEESIRETMKEQKDLKDKIRLELKEVSEQLKDKDEVQDRENTGSK
ncbi:hypothetical protein DASC09_062450 [Saccharomycopsis crataegensis]|uniref:BOD1/SHG1 domain-containing protein n=1 Tax=Saccharomycopsis crataegensis TaxID=43959 RepID=A0AAV5QW14_9ASCO|nr:hypothetical protein DASC09_062450 [Saccharomycopsis crataegensis]